jgi:hypothetical protein
MLTRRSFLATGLLAMSGSRLGAIETETALYEPAREDVERGLSYLAANQAKDGSFGNGAGQGHVAMTSLAAMAFLCGGHQPGPGTFGSAVEKAVRYVLRQAEGNGLLNHPTASPRSPMYSHGFGTLLLAETHGTLNDSATAAELGRKLRRAVQLILDTQNTEGGWRYEPTQVEQVDLSVTTAQVIALRAAANVGIDVPRSSLERSAAYLKRCQALPEGAFRYYPATGAVSFPLTAAGLVGLHCCSIHDGPAVDAARRYLLEAIPTKRPRPAINPDYYLYGHYYAVQAMRHAGGKSWSDWYTAIRDELCQKSNGSRPPDGPPHVRQADGSWSDSKYGAHYATAMACIILQRPKNYLPIFQH